MEDEYNRKLESLQQYIPFLNNMIVQLKDPRKKNREQQLAKMVSLHSMITDKRKKLKLETLIKCEDVILKLYDKVKGGPNVSLTKPSQPPFQQNCVPITPSSPSPPPDLPRTQPVVIPTEKVVAKTERDILLYPSTNNKPKIDIYSSAADSLKASSSKKPSVFDRLDKKTPAVLSKPPISIKDLEELQQDVIAENMTLNELTDLRHKLKKELSNSNKNNRSESINTTKRNTTILTKKAVEKGITSEKSRSNDGKSSSSSTATKSIKVVKETDSIFGNALSSIDNQLLESKAKEKERRSSTSLKKEYDDNDPDKKKDKEKNSLHKSKSIDKKSTTDKQKDKKDDHPKSKETIHDKEKKNTDEFKRRSDVDKQVDAPKKETVDTKKGETDKATSSKAPPVYKRLADKYNPKPRKPSTDISEGRKLIEAPSSTKPSETRPKSPPRVLTPIPQLPVPLLSPTSSTHSGDHEVSSFISKPFSQGSQLAPRHNLLHPNISPYPNQFMNRHPAPTSPFEPSPSPSFSTWNHQQQQRPFGQSHVPPSPREFYKNHNQFQPNSGPRMLSPEYNYEYDRGQNNRWPGETAESYREWKRNSTSPRVRDSGHRDPRLNRDSRDPRLRNSDENKQMPRVDTVKRESKIRDPRLNRYRQEEEKEQPKGGEEFASPLDSLYAGSDREKTGKGYGVQKFKIPKMKKEHEENEEEVQTNETQVDDNEENIALPSVTSSTENEEKPEEVKEVEEPKAETPKDTDVAAVSSTNDIPDAQTKEESTLDDPSQTDIINKFLKKLLENDRTRAAASVFIDNVSNSLDDEKLKMVVRSVAEESDKVSLLRKRKLMRRKMLLAKKKLALKKNRQIILKKQKKPVQSASKSTAKVKAKEKDDSEEENVENKEVVVSVGERIKSRRRAVATPKKKSRHKSELDMLHEDIQDMFIRDGVLTATGKRMCRLLKGENDKPAVPPVPESPPKLRRTRSNAEKIDSEKLKAMSNVRVVIPKLPFDQLISLDDDCQRYSLRRSNKESKSYAELDSDDEKVKEDQKDEEEEEEVVEEEKVEEKVKIKEKEKEKVVSPPQEIKKTEPEEKVQRKPKKRVNAWASGILPKRKKRVVEEKTEVQNEEVPELVLIEPDKNYFISQSIQFKVPCKLCDFCGKNISRHYRTTHPDSEVLSSRLEPQRAEIAIKKSIELKLNDIEDPEIRVDNGIFSCRFCDLVMNQKHPASFRDHITSHTGEYRHCCNSCTYGGASIKALKRHYRITHGSNESTKSSWIRHKVFGYICTECNFVQLDKKTVENHVNIYHLGEGTKVLRIHLSKTDDESDATIPKIPKSKSKANRKGTGQLKAKTEIDEPGPKRKKVTEEVTIKVEPKGKQKEIDISVFTCKTDIEEENATIEQERLRKMAELNETVKTSRQSLNFIDQLSSRLESCKTPEHEVIDIKSEPLEEEEIEVEEEAGTSTVEPPLTILKPIKMMESPLSTAINVAPKNNFVIKGMIQKLQGKLKEDKFAIEEEKTMKQEELEGVLPPLTPLVEKQEFKAFLSAGFLDIQKTANGLEYTCRVPSCLCKSSSRSEFVAHWEEDHTLINQSHKVTKCRICNKEVFATAFSSLLLNFFAHVENEHLCGIKSSLNAGLISIDKDKEGWTYNCLVNQCLFSKKDRDVFLAHVQSHTDIKSTKCGICQIGITVAPETNLLVTVLNHVEVEHLLEEESPKTVIRTRRLSGDKLSKSETEDEDNPFPFKISGVMSLADDCLPMPPLSPIKDKPKYESVLLKEAKMNETEKSVIRKCPQALKRFLKSPRELYKCPQLFCNYISSYRTLFDSHLKAHAQIKDELVPCVYCYVKTPLTQAGLHIDLRHASSLYSCSQCLYRAVKKEYVMAHIKLSHDSTDHVITLPPRQPKTIMINNQKTFTAAETCPPFKCGVEKCQSEFLFRSEFLQHLRNIHPKVAICGYARCSFKCVSGETLAAHCKKHDCYSLNCLICKFGCMDMPSMLVHYSENHPTMEPNVVDRRSPLEPNEGLQYTDEAFAALHHVASNQLLDSVTNIPRKTNNSLDGSSPPSLKSVGTTESENLIIIPEAVPSTSSPFVFAEINDKIEGGSVDDPAMEQAVPNEELDNSADPLSLDGEVLNSGVSGDESDSQDMESVETNIINIKNYGLTSYQLFKCAFCDISFCNTKDFKAHTTNSLQCRDNSDCVKPFKCVHCERRFKNPHGLLDHLQYHGPLRFGCSLCVKKCPSSFSLKFHMRGKHNVFNTVVTPVIPNKTDLDRDEFILRPVSTIDPKKVKADPFDKSDAVGHNMSYSPEEINDIPKRYIFISNVHCAICPYSTKVRTNLIRHLQFHLEEKSVPDIAPINPVPCLDKNEKMFDKMTNLANSSFTAGRMGGIKTEGKQGIQDHPTYIPLNRRYVCCVASCNYLCLEESNLRHHIHALHLNESSFLCPHCKKPLKLDPEGYFKHLKLHDLRLYKCGTCDFIHNLRHKVEKHSTDKHENPNSVVTIRSLEAKQTENEEPLNEISTPSNIKWTKPWHCGMCKYRCAAKNEIQLHIFNKHDINAQYKCTLCTYKTDEKQTFEEHFKSYHPDNAIDIIHVFYKSEGTVSVVPKAQFDTTPLWQRDRPRVRHIRGILFEESTSSPKIITKKASPIKAATSGLSNMELAIEAVARGESFSEKSEEVIIIEDEDESRGDKSSELLIDVEECDEETEKTVAVNKLLSEELLFEMYGKVCVPYMRCFKCPICGKFKSKVVAQFLYHLLIDLKCCRFNCNNCSFISQTQEIMAQHCQNKHNGVASWFVIDISVDKKLEYWLQLVINRQAKQILQNYDFPMGEAQATATSKVCKFCRKWFKNGSLVTEHELIHWANHKYECNRCITHFETMDSLFQHSFLTHPDYDVDLTTVDGPYVGTMIEQLKKSSAATAAVKTQKEEESAEESHACPYCTEVETTEESLKKHIWDNHKTTTTKEVMYCCTHCHERGTDTQLKQHHETQHPDLEFDIYQYICLECSKTYRTLREIRAHYNHDHPNKKLTYSCVESKPSVAGSKDHFICPRCPFRSSALSSLRSHLRKHIRPVICLVCGASFVYATEARVHHKREHDGEDKVEESAERLLEYEEAVRKIVEVAKQSGVDCRVRKMLARKSTGAPFVKKDESTGSS